MNLNRDTLDCSKLFNLSATYSKETVEYFQNLGFNNPHWVALACDPHLHKIDLGSENEFKNDISFVGMWRPEREFYLKSIVENFQNLKIEVYGNYWQRNCEKKSILKKWRGNGLYGKELGLHFNTTRINLNVIDDTNYPAANMRFFEIPAAGGLQLVSSCPEMEPYFKDKEQLVYFRTETEMLENIEWILNNENEAQMIRVSGQQLALKNHSYFSRFRNLLDLL
jgi:spore maturation protein CgeB